MSSSLSSLNISALLIKYCQASVHYWLIDGNRSSETFPPHSFVPTRLVCNDSVFVALNGSAQRLHVDNCRQTNTQPRTLATQQFSNDPLRVIPTLSLAADDDEYRLGTDATAAPNKNISLKVSHLT